MSADNTPAWAKDLSWRERIFVEEYLVDLNGKEAYKRAGLLESGASNEAARVASHRYLSRPPIAAAIETLLQERGVTRVWVIDQLARMVNVDVTEFGTFDGNKVMFKSWDDLSPDQRRMISSIKPLFDKDGTELGVEVTFHNDRKAALDKLAKLLKMEVQRTEISGPNGGAIEMSDPKARIRDRLEEMAAKLAAKAESDGEAG